MTLSALGIFSAAGAGGGFSSDYELISSTILSSNQASVSFNVSTLGSTYKHLQIRYVARDSGTFGAILNTTARFNSSSTGYYSHYLGGDGSTVASGAISTSSQLYSGVYYGAGVSNIVGAGVMDLLDPFSTTKNKTLRTLAGVAGSGIYMSSSFWANTAAVTSFEIFSNGTSFGTSSRFSLYGIRG